MLLVTLLMFLLVRDRPGHGLPTRRADLHRFTLFLPGTFGTLEVRPALPVAPALVSHALTKLLLSIVAETAKKKEITLNSVFAAPNPPGCQRGPISEIETAYDRCRVLVKRLKALEPVIQELHTVDVDGNECTVSTDGEWSIAPIHPMTGSQLSAVVDRAKATHLSKAKARMISTAQKDFKAQSAAFDNAYSQDAYSVQAPWCAFRVKPHEVLALKIL